jgi:sugar lactone lactonase YvrE
LDRAAIVTLELLVAVLISGCSPTGDGTANETKARAIREHASYPEGPIWFGGRLYYVEYGAGAVNAWDGVRSRQVWAQAGSGPTAILPLTPGEMLVTCYDKNALVRIDAHGQTLKTIQLPGDARGPNDFAKDAGGGVYFSASGVFEKGAQAQGAVYYLAPAGTIRLVADGIHYPNGLAITEGGKRLLVAEHLEGRILAFTIGTDGSLSGRAVWKRLRDIQPDPNDADWYTGPDGLKADSQGNVYVCQFGGSRILVTRPDGTWVRTVTVPCKYVTNVALSPNEDFLYVTAVNDPWRAPYPGTVYEIPNPGNQPRP